MEEIEALKHLHGFFLTGKDDSFSFIENGPEAKVKTLTIKADGVRFYYADGDAIAHMESLWKDNKHFLMHKNADGIVVFDKDGMRYLLLCEMKSSMSQIKAKVLNQVIAGYLRMSVLLGICKEKDIIDHKIVFVFTSQPISTEEQYRLRGIEMMESGKHIMDKSIPLDDKIVYRLYKTKENTFDMPLRLICPDFHQDLAHVNDRILDANIQWKLLMLSSDKVSEVEFDITRI